MITLTVQDRLDILELQSIYAWGVDRREPELFDRVFTEDVEVRYPAEVAIHGREMFARFVLTYHELHDSTQHLIANQWLEPGSDAVVMRSYVILSVLWAGTRGGDLFQAGAYYVDRVVKSGAGWRIARREATNVWSGGNQEILLAGRRDAKAAL
jgi:SnoaL-like domain